MDWKNVGKTLECIENGLNSIGLKLNRSKTKIYTKNTNQQQKRALQNQWKVEILQGFNFKMLGTFVGNRSGTDEFLNGKLKEFDKFMEMVKANSKKSKHSGQY